MPQKKDSRKTAQKNRQSSKNKSRNCPQASTAKGFGRPRFEVLEVFDVPEMAHLAGAKTSTKWHWITRISTRGGTCWEYQLHPNLKSAKKVVSKSTLAAFDRTVKQLGECYAVWGEEWLVREDIARIRIPEVVGNLYRMGEGVAA